MNWRDVLKLSFKDLSEKRARTALTVIMVMIGVAAIIGLTSLTNGVSASISSELSSLGPTSILIMPTSSAGFTFVDTSLLQSLANVTAVVPVITGSVNVYSDGQNTSATLIGVQFEDLEQVENLSLLQGTFYQDTVDPAAVIGHTIAFPSSSTNREYAAVGQPITIKINSRGGATYTIPVVGVLNTFGSSIVPVDTAVFMSLPAAEAILQRTSFNEIIVKAKNVSSVAALSSEIGDIYGNKARIISTQELTTTVSSVTGSLGLLLGIIAGISLLVAAIGIMNIMLISVYERTHEIGIFKSIGFKNRDVLAIFLFQAVIIGFLGGVVGIGTGVAASYGITAGISVATSASSSSASTTSAFPGAPTSASGARGAAPGGAAFISSSTSSSSSSLSFSPVINLGTVLIALLVAVLVSMLAGIYPAWRASKLEPIDALRQL